jgi:hypothetical protein
MKKIILAILTLFLFTGCVAMREKGNISLRQIQTDHPSVYLTARYTQFKNRERWAFMNETTRKRLIKTAQKKLEQTGLFGPIHTTPQSTDIQIHCDLRADYTPETGGEFWLNVFTLQLYPTDSSWEYTLTTTVFDRRTKEKQTVTANDIMSINSSLLFLPAAPFKSIFSCTDRLETYLFNATLNHLGRVKPSLFTVTAPR